MNWKKPVVEDAGRNTIQIPKRWLHLFYYEALNILFRFENSLRVFVYVVLKNERKELWTQVAISGANGQSIGTIESIAKQRISQAANFGYLGYEVACPVMHLTSGELVGLITSEEFWPLFKSFFKGSREIMRNKLQEIGTVRNSLAHFRPIKVDDISLLEQDAKHTLMGVERCLGNVLSTINITPTNSPFKWYIGLKPLSSDHINIDIHQSSDEQWIRLALSYRAEILRQHSFTEAHVDFQITTLKTQRILLEFPTLAKHVTYVTEDCSGCHFRSTSDYAFRKTINLVFSKSCLEVHGDELIRVVQDFIDGTIQETALLKGDELARGRFVFAANVVAYKGQGDADFRVYNANMKCGFNNDDPPEYWAELGVHNYDFISATNVFPWMESAISLYDPW